jgi:hypothetical protein
MSIPGSVGFSYARVAGAAPSKGKYAKKTMASAQKGNNIKKDATDIAASDKIAQLQLLESPEYQYRKYLESLPQLRQAPGRGEELMRKGLGYADVATDVMQLGNFIPNPIAQTIGKAGNLAGTFIDAYQAVSDVYKGNYTSAGINAASAILPSFLGANTFRRNSKYLTPGQPLYSLSPQAKGSLDRVNYIEPFNKVKGMTDKSLMYNRALLGALGGETAYDAGLIGPVKKEYGGEIPSAQTGIMTPMLLARNVLNYFYPSEETTNTIEAAPVNYKKGLTNELLQRQAYKESTFNPAAVSPAGYKGLTQIGEGVLKDYSNKKGGKKLDPFNPEDAVELQKFAMDDLYNASFINKPNQPDSVRIAKTLAAYNWGRGNLSNYLNEQKSKGVDIYDSYDWLNNLPKETSDYVNKIFLQEDPSFNKNYKKASTNPKYEEVTSLYDQKKFGGNIPSAQNGQEMRFYQNGLDWKPRSMQNGGEEEMYEGQQLPEFTITPYDEQYPFYQTLSPEQKKYINDEGPIGRGIRAIATTGKVGQTAKDISTPYRSVQEVASEVTGIPGTIRFSNDPVKNLKGAGKTLLDLGIAGSSAFSPTGYGSLGGYNPITKEELFNQENLEGTFNTIDALGLGSMMVAPLVKPTSAAARAVVKATREIAQPHLTSISNVANETLDAVQAINNVKKFEKLSMIDVPALPGIDKLKDVRNFGKELAELESKSKNASLSDLNSLREKYTKLSEQAKEFKSSNIFKLDDAKDYDIYLRLIYNKLNKLSNFKLDDFINNLKKQGANKVALEKLRSNPDLALRYFDTVSSFSDSRMAEEIFTGDTLSTLENFRTYPNSGKTTNFSPDKRSINSDRIDPITGNIQWSGSTDLIKVDNKLYEEDWGSDKFYSYPFYKNVGDKIVNAYSNLRLSGSPVISPMQRYSEAIELMPSLFANRYNVGSMLRQASRYIDETPDGLMFPAGSLSGDSYPLALNMMARELKNNPDSQLRLIGFGRSNELGFADKVNNPKLLQSELSQIIKGIEDVSGQRLPKPYIFGNNTDQIMLPKFAISKGSTNKVIQDYLNNTSIADRLGVKRPVREVKRPVREVSSNPATPISNPPPTIDFDPPDYDFDTNFKNGGVTKDNQGYWNPNNWGQPVEIDSNDITMEGVYEPLIGVSDTGDTKLMKPGKNYKFKGKKVTEYPVAKLGINQLDAQPMKKLNQLLNFTNNPDKDNWLDKYN